MLELVDGIDRDPSAAPGVDAVKRHDRSGRGLCRAALGAEPFQQRGDVIDRQRAHPPWRERRQEVTLEVVAVRLERARGPLAGSDQGLEARKPPSRDGAEPKPRRRRLKPSLDGRYEGRALGARERQIVANGAGPQPARTPRADGVLAVGQKVDPKLRLGHHHTDQHGHVLAGRSSQHVRRYLHLDLDAHAGQRAMRSVIS